MQIKKDNIIYNLDKYKKICMNEEILALCLYDEQGEEYGEFDAIYFDSLEELQRIFNLISPSENPIIQGIQNRDEPLDLDSAEDFWQEEEHRAIADDITTPNNLFVDNRLVDSSDSERYGRITLSASIDTAAQRMHEIEEKNEELEQRISNLQSVIDYLVNKVNEYENRPNNFQTITTNSLNIDTRDLGREIPEDIRQQLLQQENIETRGEW